jgi:hypothetical protein
MLAVLLVFLIPFGGGIPAGVLLAQARGLPWELTAGIYAISDLVLAVVFESVLIGFAAVARRRPPVARYGAAVKGAMAQNVALVGGVGAGPLRVILIAFGVEPMTGRTAALLAGYGPLPGWAFAITGDMGYYALIALSTLGLNAWLKHPKLTAWIILGAMYLWPMAAQRIRAGIARRRGAAA